MKLTKPEQQLIEKIKSHMHLSWDKHKRRIRVFIDLELAYASEQRAAARLMVERGLIDTTKRYVHEVTPLFWEHIGTTAKQMLIDKLQADIRYELACSLEPYPQAMPSQWRIKMLAELYKDGTMTAERAYWIEWQRVAHNRVITEENVQLIEQEISQVEVMA